jgi:hypothetical protein
MIAPTCVRGSSGSPKGTLRDSATTFSTSASATSSCTMIRLPELQHSPALK